MQRVITEAQKSKFLVAIDRGVIACVRTFSLSLTDNLMLIVKDTRVFMGEYFQRKRSFSLPYNKKLLLPPLQPYVFVFFYFFEYQNVITTLFVASMTMMTQK